MDTSSDTSTEAHQFSTSLLSIEEKLDLANRVIINHNSYLDVGKSRNIPKSTIQTMVDVVRSGKKLRLKAGRPKLLDEIAFSEIEALVQQHEIVDKNHFKEIFIEKMKDTFIRRYIDGF